MNNGPKAVFFGGDVGTWGANPWIIHNKNSVSTAYGDGHVKMASRTQLKEQTNKSVKIRAFRRRPAVSGELSKIITFLLRKFTS